LLRIKIVIVSVLLSLLLPLNGNVFHAAEVNDENKTVEQILKENKEESITEKDDTVLDNNPIDDTPGESIPDSQFTFFDFLNLIFALFLVLMLLYVTLRFIKKKNQTYDFTRTMANLGGTSLGNNRSVQLVKVGDRILVVGVAENIQLLKEIDSEEEIKQILSQQQNDVQQILQPADIITKLVQQVKGYKKREIPNQDSSFKSMFATQLAELSKGRKKILKELDEEGKKSDD
jgi:flagellar protein FliO/FliZ